MEVAAKNFRANGMGLARGAALSGAGIVLAVVTGFKADAPFPLVFGELAFAAGGIFSAFVSGPCYS